MAVVPKFTHEYRVGVQTLYVHDLPEETPRLYKRAGEESDPVALAEYDGVALVGDQILRFNRREDSGLVVGCHGWTGIEERYTERDEVDAVKLERVPATD
jgi:hypothetical protein